MPSGILAHSSYLIAHSGRGYLLDCGEGASSSMVRQRVDTSTIETIFISHTHSDHILGLPMFLQMEYLKNRTASLRVHVPAEFTGLLQSLLEGVYLFPGKLRFEFAIVPIEEGFVFDDGYVRISAKPNSHLRAAVNIELLSTGKYSNRMQCFSFEVAADGRRLLYSGDIGTLDDIVEEMVGVDLLVVEGVHCNMEQLPRLLIESGVGRCVLTHLPSTSDRAGIRQMFQKAGFDELDFAAEGFSVDMQSLLSR
jgi:ribonuclease Z